MISENITIPMVPDSPDESDDLLRGWEKILLYHILLLAIWSI